MLGVMVEIPAPKSKVGMDGMAKPVYDTQLRAPSNVGDISKPVYNTQMLAPSNMPKTVYDSQMRTDGNMTNAVYDTQIRTGDSMTNAGYGTQMQTDGNMTKTAYDTQIGAGGSVVNAVYDTQMRTNGIPQTKMGTKQAPVYSEEPQPAPAPAQVYSEVPQPAPPRPRGIDYGGSAFDAVALPRPRGTDYGGGDKGAGDAVGTSKDGAISLDEFTTARAASNPVNGSGIGAGLQTEKYLVPVTRYYKRTVMETRERQVPVPYYVDVPETKYRTITEEVPVQKSKA